MGFTSMFGGPGLPVTWHNFLRTYYVHSSSAGDNPGKRTSSADLTYRIPGLRPWLTFYLDSMVVDEISPIGSTRANINLGLHMPQVPRIPKLELRAEGMNESTTKEFTPGFVYTDVRRFRDGYTNDGLLLGSWIGRAGHGGQGWATYHFAPRTSIDLSYRRAIVDPKFLQGGNMTDVSLESHALLRHSIELSLFIQYEHRAFPILASAPTSDVTGWCQLTFWPDWGHRLGRAQP